MNSFLLHAPLELQARVALLPSAFPQCRLLARLRILSLVARYQAAGDPVEHIPRSSSFADAREARSRLLGAIAAGELAEVDRAAVWLGEHCGPFEIASALADDVVDRLGAAGHGNIYLMLAPSCPGSALLLRPLARELAKDPRRRVGSAGVNPTRPRHNGAGLSVIEALACLPLIGQPSERGIASMVQHAEYSGEVSHLVNAVSPVSEPSAHQLLAAAASMMMQGPARHVPYGWTHCLTLSQAALAQHSAVRAGQAFRIASTYVAAHWACLAEQTFDPAFIPPSTELEFEDAVKTDPLSAAGAVYWAPTEKLDSLEAHLATRAVTAHDAHYVKYTLACVHAAAADPSNRRLFLAAAAYLAAWWSQNENPDDPDPLSAQIPDLEALNGDLGDYEGRM